MWLLACFLNACAKAITVSENGSEVLGPHISLDQSYMAKGVEGITQFGSCPSMCDFWAFRSITSRLN